MPVPGFLCCYFNRLSAQLGADVIFRKIKLDAGGVVDCYASVAVNVRGGGGSSGQGAELRAMALDFGNILDADFAVLICVAD